MTSFCAGVEWSLESSLFALLEDVARIYPQGAIRMFSSIKSWFQQAQHTHCDPFISTEYSGHHPHHSLPMRVLKTPSALKCAEKASTLGV